MIFDISIFMVAVHGVPLLSARPPREGRTEVLIKYTREEARPPLEESTILLILSFAEYHSISAIPTMDAVSLLTSDDPAVQGSTSSSWSLPSTITPRQVLPDRTSSFFPIEPPHLPLHNLGRTPYSWKQAEYMSMIGYTDFHTASKTFSGKEMDPGRYIPFSSASK